MSNGTLQIGKKSYPLAPTYLYSILQPGEAAPFLSLDLHAASDGRTTAGLAINSLSLFDRSSIEQLQGLRLRFSRAADDPRIELGESVLVEPGRHLFDLEVNELSLEFGQIRENRIPVDMHGMCSTLVASEVEFEARFDAEIR
jgi:hypothetical protein